MPLLVLILVSLAAGSATGLLSLRWSQRFGTSRRPSVAAARSAGRFVGEHPRLQALVAARLDPETATGLALTAALILVVGGGLILGLLAYLVRADPHLLGIDGSVARWGNRHATPFSTHGLNAITQLGTTTAVAVLGTLVIAVDLLRNRNVWSLPFLLVVVIGEKILTTTIKDLVDRLRPTLNPIAATLGPSFPSGHTATAAAFFAAAALLLGRHQSPRIRASLAGLAVGIAVAVASSRVLLDVHWLTDVIGGLMLGWAWFGACAIAFGGRLLRFGAGAEIAADATEAEQQRDPPRPTRRTTPRLDEVSSRERRAGSRQR